MVTPLLVCRNTYIVPPSFVRGIELDVLLELLPLELNDRVVARAVPVVLGKEFHGLLVAAISDIPAGGLGEEPN